jgi:hypothetical protein
MVEFIVAITARTKAAITATETVESPEKIPDFDKLIGMPIGILIEPSKPNPGDGFIYNNIKGFVAPSQELSDAIRVLYKSATFGLGTKSGHKQLLSPATTYLEKGGSATPATTADAVAEEDAFDSVPF